MDNQQDKEFEEIAAKFLRDYYQSGVMKDKYEILNLEFSFDRVILGAVKAGYKANTASPCMYEALANILSLAKPYFTDSIQIEAIKCAEAALTKANQGGE